MEIIGPGYNFLPKDHPEYLPSYEEAHPRRERNSKGDTVFEFNASQPFEIGRWKFEGDVDIRVNGLIQGQTFLSSEVYRCCFHGEVKGVDLDHALWTYNHFWIPYAREEPYNPDRKNLILRSNNGAHGVTLFKNYFTGGAEAIYSKGNAEAFRVSYCDIVACGRGVRQETLQGGVSPGLTVDHCHINTAYDAIYAPNSSNVMFHKNNIHFDLEIYPDLHRRIMSEISLGPRANRERLAQYMNQPSPVMFYRDATAWVQQVGDNTVQGIARFKDDWRPRWHAVLDPTP